MVVFILPNVAEKNKTNHEKLTRFQMFTK